MEKKVTKPGSANPKIEILAPVGSPKTLEAAVFAGADCVYLGLQGFNARRGAGNFTPDELRDAVRLCHAHGVGVHVTLNTLVFADELPEVQRALEIICSAGADAVLVQDWGVARLARRCAPGLKLHASTQMAVTDLAGALKAREEGFSRVVLARELSKEEIAFITQNCGIETEVFVHGAQCMSVSGQCYLSAFLGGRSGNRGGCAQPCRLPCSAFIGAKAPARTAQQTGDFHLSLKDMSALENLPELEKLGVASVKIEGRLRPAEYVAAAVHAARLARDGQPYDKLELEQVFSRSGFTDGYFTGRRTKEMFGVRRAEDLAATRAAEPRIREYYRRPLQRVPVTMQLTLEEDGAKLAVSDGVLRAVAYTETEPRPEPGPTYEEAIKKSLSKTGGTPFYTSEPELTVEGAQQYFMPLSEINTLRRTALDTLYEKRADAHKTLYHPWEIPGEMLEGPQETDFGKTAAQLLVGRFESPAQLPEELESRFRWLIFPLRQAQAVPAALRGKTVLEVPRGNFGDDEKLSQRIEAAKALGFTRFEANNLGHFTLLKGCEIWGGFALNTLNPLAAQAYLEMGAHTLTLGCELRLSELGRFSALGIPLALLAYGRLPVMMTRACPLQNVTDCAVCPKRGRLLDRKGEQLPVVCRGTVREIYNPIPLWMGERRHEMPCDLLTLYFTWESPDRVRRVTEMFCAGQPFDEKFTRGLYYADR